MTGFKIKDWVMARLSKAKAGGRVARIRFGNLTGAMKTIVSKFRSSQQSRGEWLKQMREGSARLWARLNGKLVRRSGNPVEVSEDADTVHAISASEVQTDVQVEAKAASGWMVRHRRPLVGGLSILGLVLVGTFSIQSYVQAHTYEVYQVYVKDQLVGKVSSPRLVDDFKITKVQEIQEKNPNVHMVLNTDEVVLKPEKAYNAQSDDQATLERLGSMMTAHAVGVELVVNDKTIGIVKDKDTANAILSQIKAKYGGAPAAGGEKGSTVSILSASDDQALDPGESKVEKVDFVEKVDVKQKDIDPSQVMKPDDVLAKLQTGDVQPTKYTVQQGDCVGCIAKKFNISKQVIYENNPWIVDDMIKAGQVLDLTVLQPTLSVKTVEKVVEQQEIQYDTDYQKDDSMRAGIIQVISPGKNGMKNVTFQVTKINGKMMDETMVEEKIIEQPVKAVAKKGTKVVLGEGTGKFAWPVVGASISSGFGYRWGKLHKGVDLTGNKSILAADNGKITDTGYKSDYGNYIIISHMNGYETLYGHLSKVNVQQGQIVEKGEKIGIMGSTGDSTGTHLHFEIHKNGDLQNPLKYLNQ